MTGTSGQRARPGVVDTRMIGKSDEFDGDPMRHKDSSFKLTSYPGFVDQRNKQELTTTETSSTPKLNGTFGSEKSAFGSALSNPAGKK